MENVHETLKMKNETCDLNSKRKTVKESRREAIKKRLGHTKITADRVTKVISGGGELNPYVESGRLQKGTTRWHKVIIAGNDYDYVFRSKKHALALARFANKVWTGKGDLEMRYSKAMAKLEKRRKR